MIDYIIMQSLKDLTSAASEKTPTLKFLHQLSHFSLQNHEKHLAHDFVHAFNKHTSVNLIEYELTEKIQLKILTAL